MRKFFVFFIAYLFQIISLHAVSDPGLSVVVGCDGTPGQLQRYFQMIMGPSDCRPHHEWLHVDLRSKETAACPHDKYQQADAKIWTPSAGRQISKIFMELFPSRGVANEADLRRFIYQNYPEEFERDFESTKAGLIARYPILKATLGASAPSLEQLFEDARTKMSQAPTISQTLMPDAIRNLAKHMRAGATLEIEHIPYTTVRGMALSPDMAARITERNPFHLNISPLFLDLLKASLEADSDKRKGMWAETITRLRDQKIKDTQIEALIEEAKAGQALCTTATSNIKRLMQENGMNEKDFARQLYEEITAFSDDLPSHDKRFKTALSVVIAVELYMLQNQAHPDSGVQRFLKENGFRDVRIERAAVNPHNGRKNSWMITAVRDDRPVKLTTPSSGATANSC